MPRIRFDDLLLLYRNIDFGDAADEEVRLTVASQAIAELLTLLEADDEAAADAGITLLDDPAEVVVGADVRVRVTAPRTGLGVLSHDLDGLLNSPGARIDEPARYYLVDGQFSSGAGDPPDGVARYRKVLSLLQLFAEAASFLDTTKAELVYVKDGRIIIPIRFAVADLSQLDMADADRLLDQFSDALHNDQKLEILFEAMVSLCTAQPVKDRFEFALRNLGHLADAVRDGYKLFASSFSYSKVRSELEDARIEYTSKIHKTIVDIQGQLLGIPIATVVVASQMKTPTDCGAEPAVNSAILLGAWIFLALLMVGIVNQWLTLNVIKAEISRQKGRLVADYPTVTADFVGTFDSLDARIWWHHLGLAAVAVMGIAGASAATYLHGRINAIPPRQCASVDVRDKTFTSRAGEPAAARPAMLAKPIAAAPAVAGERPVGAKAIESPRRAPTDAAVDSPIVAEPSDQNITRPEEIGSQGSNSVSF